jgi:FlaA1/EpsC-like NDP-sugar epimerase
MGEPVKIVDLARNLILLSGLKPDEDIKIEFTGMRPGEKLYEELSTMLEDTVPTAHEKIRIFVGNGMPEGDMLAWLDCLRRDLPSARRRPPGRGAERDRARLQPEHGSTEARHKNSGTPFSRKG